MRHLIRQATIPGEKNYVDVELTHNEAEDMIQLNELDSATVRSERKCVECGYEPLKTREGIIYCQNCGSSYKVFKDRIYEIL